MVGRVEVRSSYADERLALGPARPVSVVVVAGTLVGILPAWRITRQSLTDGPSVRI